MGAKMTSDFDIIRSCKPGPNVSFPQPPRTHMQDLQEVTQDLHYENFRSERLKRGGRLSSHGYILPLSPPYVLLPAGFSAPPLDRLIRFESVRKRNKTVAEDTAHAASGWN